MYEVFFDWFHCNIINYIELNLVISLIATIIVADFEILFVVGARIRVEGQTAEVLGVKALRGAALHATDLRGGAAMILAGLAAEGETLVFDEGHVRRGYEDLDRCLESLGAEITLEQ